jgi:hypothetical protein
MSAEFDLHDSNSFDVVPTGLQTSQSNNIVFSALTANKGLYSLYVVYRQLEIDAQQGRNQTSNKLLADAVHMSAVHVGRCVRVLARIGVIRTVLPPDGNKAGRRIEVLYHLDRWVLRVLDGIIARQVKIDLRQATVAHEPTGREINAITRSLKALLFENGDTSPLDHQGDTSPLDHQGDTSPLDHQGDTRDRSPVIQAPKKGDKGGYLTNQELYLSSCLVSSSSSQNPPIAPPLTIQTRLSLVSLRQLGPADPAIVVSRPTKSRPIGRPKSRRCSRPGRSP